MRPDKALKRPAVRGNGDAEHWKVEARRLLLMTPNARAKDLAARDPGSRERAEAAIDTLRQIDRQNRIARAAAAERTGPAH
jgi:hypothetical protein